MVRNLKIAILLIAVLSACSMKAFRGPKVLTKDGPDYPLSAQLERAEGEVSVAVFVNSEGFVDEVEVIKSSGRKDLDNASKEFAENLKFRPASFDGRPLSTWTQLVLKFKLTDILFDENEWIFEATSLKNEYNKVSSEQEKEHILEDLYKSYQGLFNYIDKNPSPDINKSIRKVISDDLDKKWQPFWSKYPLGFTVLEDFIKLYPKSKITNMVKERLTKELINVRYEFALKNITLNSDNSLEGSFLQVIDQRLKELGVIIPISSD